ncbi:MAG: gamma-butyrobetaine dioxygenase [Paraglaciecola psychrophila]|jgi:gamma-butyrobetaine dioxygenase
MSATPDFDHYPRGQQIRAAAIIEHGVSVSWDDGIESQFHVYWLRENAADEVTCHPESKEQQLQLLELPEDLAATQVGVSSAGELQVEWSTGDSSCFDPGWLRAYCHRAAAAPFALPTRQHWNAQSLGAVPRFDGPSVLTDRSVFKQWCLALHNKGVAILENLPTDPAVIEQIPALIGPIRQSNFGYSFDVRTATESTSNAYTSMALPLHSDLCTREFMPGLQFLHCLENSTDGGDSLLADGFYLAQLLQQQAPHHYATLSTVPMDFYNKAKDSDYRFSKPLIGLDSNGELDEIRLSPWLRAPLDAPLETVDRCYRALRYLLQLSEHADSSITTRLQPGDLLAFDNRRIFHGRTGFDASRGDRWLRGCYGEREELWSQLRILAREQRAAAGQ